MKKLSNLIPDFLVKRCPKSGRIVKLRFDNIYAKIAFPLVGILAIIWFLVRVIPKPSRVAYPCQQVAAGIGGTFLLQVLGVFTSLAIYEKIRSKFSKKAALGFIASVAVIASISVSVAVSFKNSIEPIVAPPEGVNAPMGVAKGMFPGRVAWIQDFDATSWDGETGNWWEDKNTNQPEVEKMLSATLQGFTDTKSDKKAWGKLFVYHNQQNGKGKKGYAAGEKIVVKLNINATGKPDDKWTDKGYPSPQMVYALVSQLIEVAGVRGEDITLTDPSRFIGGPIVDKIRANPSPEFQKVMIEVNNSSGLKGYRTAEPDSSALIWFNMPDGKKFKMCLPKSYTEATYIINYSVVRPHRVFGITSAAKNNFGSVWSFKAKKFNPGELHTFALWDYPTPNKLGDAHCSPVLLGHKINNSKTFLYLTDGLYAAYNQSGSVKRMSSFNNDWFSSLLMSQDPVALESVVSDFISNEPNLVTGNPSFNGNQDSQFQECALANNPPSGTKYDPESDGIGLQSLGVHEHWNNPVERKYSRNLGKGKGIELLRVKL
jgi:hypothetical protein